MYCFCSFVLFVRLSTPARSPLCFVLYFFYLCFSLLSFVSLCSLSLVPPSLSLFYLPCLSQSLSLCMSSCSSSPPPFSRPFSGFYKAREGLVSLPPEMAGIVEARDLGLQKRHRGYSGRDLLHFPLAMICWIFPC